MNATNDQPAFPTPAGVQHNDGMTLRQHYAGQAMAAMIMAYGSQGHGLSKVAFEISRMAYDYADAMIETGKA